MLYSEGFKMRYVKFGTYTGAENMQIDSDLLDEAIEKQLQEPIFRLYAWKPRCITLGRNQKDDFIKALSMRISTARTDDESELSHPIQSTKQPRNTDRQQSNRLHMLIAKIKGICNH